jgi:hypothetical protein
VVPVSLDQPETAVALGAHHVPHDGTGTRTQQVSGQPDGNLGGVTAPYPTAVVTPGPSYPGTGPQPAPRYGGFPAQPQPASRGRNKPLLIGVTAALVLVLVVVLGIVVLAKPGLPSAQDCQEQGGTDDKGFTRCLRQLAGGIAENAKCESGVKGLAENALSKVDGTKVTCWLPSANGSPEVSVAYGHSPVTGAGQDISDSVVGESRGERVEAAWEGNGLSGRYQATTNDGVGLLVFTVSDRPVFGVLAVIDTTSRGLKANDLADLFERRVQPGT